MSTQFSHCKIYRTSNQTEIKSTLEQNPLNFDTSNGILIGSRAARYYLPNFRGTSNDNNADYDIIMSSNILLKWLCRKEQEINTIHMIIPRPNDDDQLDLYIYCTLHDGSKYDFVVPRSSASYTAYILNNSKKWFRGVPSWQNRHYESKIYYVASVKLLLILKKYMLYYSHQWEKTAKDYRELLTVTEPLTDDDMILCALFKQYNEKIHGKRFNQSNELIINPTKNREGISINRDDFLQYTNTKRISFIYQTAISLSIDKNLLTGLEYMCTQGPLWLADYIIENWLDIHQEKFKHKFQLPPPAIAFPVENYRLFDNIPEVATTRILHFVTSTADFYSMRLVCKHWYTILHSEIFWRDLYVSRYGQYSGQTKDVTSWKMLYFVRMEGIKANDNNKLNKLVDTTIGLRQYNANDVLKLWEDLTHQEQTIEPVLLSKINYILSNSFYYEISNMSEEYSVRLILVGFEDACSRSKLHLKLRLGEYGSSRFTDHMEELSIEYRSSTNEKRSLQLLGPQLVGFYMAKWGYRLIEDNYIGQTSNSISSQYPSGLLICLFILMVHPDHRGHFIKYVKDLERRCLEGLSWF